MFFMRSEMVLDAHYYAYVTAIIEIDGTMPRHTSFLLFLPMVNNDLLLLFLLWWRWLW